MSMKRTDLEKNRGLKINARMGAAGFPERFAAGAGSVIDKRGQRKLDQAAGLIPFACKLPACLVKDLQAAGVTVTKLSQAEHDAFAKATRPVFDKWKKQIGEPLVNEAEKAIAARKR